MFTSKSASKKRIFLTAFVLAMLTIVSFIQPSIAHAAEIAGVSAGKLAETGDIVSAIVFVTGALAVLALVILIISKKSRSRKKQEWKYPF